MNQTPLAALVAALAIATPPSAPAKRPMVVPRALMALAEGVRDGGISHPQRPPRPADYGKLPDLPPNVIPKTFAMDQLVTGETPRDKLAMDGLSQSWGLGSTGGIGGGLWFPGYPYLAELTQISEYREPCETVAQEMTRKWFELQSKSGGDKSEKIAQIMAECERLNVRHHFYRSALHDCEFGRGQIYLDVGANEQQRQLPLEISPKGIAKGALKSINSMEPYWSTPYSWNASYPERSDFYKPISWYIMGRKTHADRLLTFIGREVPDLLKPMYNFSGISMIQLGEMSVNMWLRTRKAVNDLVNNFSLLILASDLNSTLEDGNDPAGGLIARMKAFTDLRNNQGINLINKDSEEIQFAEATLAGLDKLQAQSQEHMAAVWGIPLVKLFGITPAGLGATAEGEIQVWYDRVNSMQVRLFQPNLEILLKAIQCSLFGEIDDDLVIHWITLDEPTQKELSEIRKSGAEMDATYITNGVITPDEARTRLQSDPDSGYSNLTGSAPEPEPDPEPTTDPEGDAQREHEATQAELDRQHEAGTAVLAAAAKPAPAVPIKAKTGK